MSNNNINKAKKPLGNIEFFAFLLAIFLGIKDAPEVFNLLTFNILKDLIKGSVWSWVYLFIVSKIALKYLNANEPLPEPTIEGIKESIDYNIQKWRIQEAIFSLGLTPFREYILGKMNVEQYGTEENPNDSKHFPYRDKIFYKNSHFEYNYPRDYSGLVIMLRSWEKEEDRPQSNYKKYEESATRRQKNYITDSIKFLLVLVNTLFIS